MADTKTPAERSENMSRIRSTNKVLDLIHFFYTWMIPVLLQVINTVKITLEWKATPGTATTWVNTLIYAFLLVLTILFLIFLHTPAKPAKHPKKK